MDKSIIGKLKLEREARQYAEDIISTVREPLLVLDINLKILLVNKAFYQTFMVNPKETIGWFIYDVGNHQWNIPKLRQLLDDILPQSSSFENYEVKNVFESIGQKTMLLNARCIPQPPAKPKIILLAIEDITKRRELEEALEETRETKEKIILEAIGDGVAACNASGKIILFNHASEELSGFCINEAVGKHYSQILSFIKEDKKNTRRDFIGQAMKEGKATPTTNTNHMLIIKKDGTRIPVAGIAAPLFAPDGKKAGCVVVYRDVGQEREIQQIKDDFLNVAAHDLRTPMSEIRANIEMILSGDYGKITPKMIIPLQGISKANLNLIRMVDDFLTISRIEKGKITISTKPIDLLPVVNSLIKQAKPLVEKAGLKFSYTIPVKLPLVMADSDKVMEVINNLLDNALKFTDQGVINLRVFLREEDVVVALADTGPGILTRQQKDLFQKYAQFGDRKKMIYGKGTGLGLGLYISRLIVEDCFRGKIWVESQLGKGSTFYFSLLLAKGKEKYK